MLKENKRCTICFRDISPDGKFCKYHKAVNIKLQSNFSKWVEAYNNLSLQNYLEHIIKLPESGIWVKEVAEYNLALVKKRNK